MLELGIIEVKKSPKYATGGDGIPAPKSAGR